MKNLEQIQKIDQRAYRFERGYLPKLNIPGVTDKHIEKYLNPLSFAPKPTTKNELYKRILESAQNAL